MNARTLTAFACAIAALASLGSVPAAAGERLDNIVKNNTLRVGTPGDYRPFAMKEDSGYAGHDIDVVKAMAEVYGWKVEFVPTTWKQMAADLKDNRFDVAVGGITRSPARALIADFLPAYAPFGKVALVNVKMKNKFRTLDDLNQPDVRVIKNPGGTNEAFVLANLTRAKVSTHDKNFEIPGLIAEGRGDVMITENAEEGQAPPRRLPRKPAHARQLHGLHAARRRPRLHARDELSLGPSGSPRRTQVHRGKVA